MIDGRAPAGESASPKAVFFDLGDTLFPFTEIMHGALGAVEEWTRRRCLEIDPRDLTRRFLEIRPRHDGPATNNKWGIPLSIWLEAGKGAGLCPDDALRVATEYRAEVRRRIEPDPAVAGLLADMRRSGIAVGLVTNGTAIEQLDTVRALGLLELIDGFAISELVGVSKPDARIFQHALDSLQVMGPQSWFVGDEPDADYPAERVGMTSFLVGDAGGDDMRRIAGVLELRRLIPGLG